MADEPEDLPETLTIILRKPVTLGSESYAQLVLSEPTAAQWQQWDKLTGVAADVRAVAIVSGIPEPAVALIGARDLLQAAKYLARFLD